MKKNDDNKKNKYNIVELCCISNNSTPADINCKYRAKGKNKNDNKKKKIFVFIRQR